VTRFVFSSFDEEPKLLDFLKAKTKASNREIKAALDHGYCKVNGLIETIATKQLKIKDTIEIASLWQEWIHKKNSPIQVLYEDEDFFIIDKPEGLVSEETDIQKEIQKNYFLVHRLDKETSGVLILAKNMKMKNQMMSLFSQRNVHKTYVAIVDGSLKEKKGKMESFLALKARLHGQRIYQSDKNRNGDYALTYFEKIQEIPTASAVLVFPVTGRTHQLRVQFKELGHPILGDFLYEKKFVYPYLVRRMFLHSYSIEFKHPRTRKPVSIKAPLPVEFTEIIPTINVI
jgi:RluA family pseudouridine synthase